MMANLLFPLSEPLGVTWTAPRWPFGVVTVQLRCSLILRDNSKSLTWDKQSPTVGEGV